MNFSLIGILHENENVTSKNIKIHFNTVLEPRNFELWSTVSPRYPSLLGSLKM
jgi:hypothetical protein